jgi:hypothetical protein
VYFICRSDDDLKQSFRRCLHEYVELRENADKICVASIQWDHVGKGLGLGEWLSGVGSTDLSQIVGQLISILQSHRTTVPSCRQQKSKQL